MSWELIGDYIPGEEFADLSGHSVAISRDGHYVVIGAILNDGDDDSSKDFDLKGQARVFKRDPQAPSGWTQIGDSIDGEEYVNFAGFSVAISDDGKTVAIGATGNDGEDNSTDIGTFTGNVRVFERDEDNEAGWSQVGDNINGQMDGSAFGFSISMSGDGKRLMIGAPFEDDESASSGTNVGAVRVYERDDEASSGWNKIGDTIFGQEDDTAVAGWSVAISGDGKVIAVGEPGNDQETNEGGKVHMYKYNDGAWDPMGDYFGSGPTYNAGRSVSLSYDGHYVAIGQPGDDGASASSPNDDVGSVVVLKYDTDGNMWDQVGDKISGIEDKDEFGYVVSLSDDGRTLAVGATTESQPGYVAVFCLGKDDMDNDVWKLFGEVIPVMDVQNIPFPFLHPISLNMAGNGDFVAIGSPFSDMGRGTTGIYESPLSVERRNRLRYWLSMVDTL